MIHLDALKIGFVGGGKMAEAMIQGFLKSNRIPAQNITVTNTGSSRIDYLKNAYGVSVLQNDAASNLGAQSVARSSDILVLAVKPQVSQPVLGAVGARTDAKTVVVSVMAGIPIAALEEHCAAPVVRVMPTVAMAQLNGISAIAAGSHCTDEQLQTITALFALAGDTYVIPESQLDAVTALGGCGIAYAMMFIEALADAGVAAGIQRADAYRIAAQMLCGAGSMVLAGEHPAKVKDDVCSPGGATIAGVRALENGAFRATVMDAVCASAERLDEMRALR